MPKFYRILSYCICTFAIFSFALPGNTQVTNTGAEPSPGNHGPEAAFSRVSTAKLDREIREFLDEQLAAHVKDIPTLSPAPSRVVGALTVGEFSWGTFMRSLAAYSQLSGSRTIAGRDIPQMIGKIGMMVNNPMEMKWAQYYAALSLESFGTDLNHNAVWQSLSPADKDVWRSLLDPGRFYDRQTKTVIQLPQNYLGVAARIAVIDYQLGILTDRTYVDEILNQAARQFTSGELFADDDLPNGRYDRYSLEYARYVYAAAELAGRKDILQAIAPSLKTQMRLWWDLLSPDGYGYPWGRSLGVISYIDTMEIVAFLLQHPEFAPAPAPELATAYSLAWQSLHNDFRENTHLLGIFEFGRGQYSYITKEREWQQTTAFFGKVAAAELVFSTLMEKSKIADFPSSLNLPEVSRFQFFTQRPGRKFGVWVVRNSHFQFALPIVTGQESATSDYLPAPQGLTGVGIPVEQPYPCLVPFLELDDHTSLVAAEGADEIQPSADGQSLTAVWKNWTTPESKSGITLDPGLTATVTWQIQGDHIRRTETLLASKPLHVKRWWVAVPSTASDVAAGLKPGSSSSMANANSARIDRFTSPAGTLSFEVVHSDWPMEVEIKATGDSVLGKGARGPVPLLLILSSANLKLEPGQPRKWESDLAVTRLTSMHETRFKDAASLIPGK